jgi:hypothetical protein
MNIINEHKNIKNLFSELIDIHFEDYVEVY